MIIIYAIIATTVVISFLCFGNRELFEKLMFKASSIVYEKDYKRLLSYGFVHADWIHLFFNMYVLYSFSSVVCFAFTYKFIGFGSLMVLLFYLSAIVVSSIADVKKHKDNPYYSAVGASGAVSALLYSAILLQPSSSIGIMFIPIGIPAPIFGLAYLFYCWYMSKKGTSNIGHSAHFWGALYGIVFTILFIPESVSNFGRYLSHFFSNLF